MASVFMFYLDLGFLAGLLISYEIARLVISIVLIVSIYSSHRILLIMLASAPCRGTDVLL